MTTNLARFGTLIFDQPHLITPSAASTIMAALSDKLNIASVAVLGETTGQAQAEPQANGFVGDWAYDEQTRRPKGYRLTGKGTAIVPIVGELVNRGAWLGASSGLVSYEGLRQTFQNATDDPRVFRVLLDINSPGGHAAGMIETANALRTLAEKKPVAAYANTLMCSAAYGIASGATKIAAAQFATVGSIGVIWVHQDHSRRLDREGVTVTIISSGDHKADGNPFEPLPAAVRAEYQRISDRIYGAFIDTVTSGRPGLTESAVRATKARCYDSEDARDIGLIDEVTTFDSLLTAFEGGASLKDRLRFDPAGGPPPKEKRKARMDAHLGAGADAPGWQQMTLSELNEAVDRLRATVGVSPEAQVVPVGAAKAAVEAAPPTAPPPQANAEDDGAAHARGVADGRTQERTRVAAILGCDAAKSRPVQARVLACETDMAPERAATVLATMPEEGKASAAREFYGAVPTPNVPAAEGPSEGAAGTAETSSLVASARAMNARRTKKG